jgi:hypothetical protein
LLPLSADTDQDATVDVSSDRLPTLSQAVVPPAVLGTAALTHFAYQGNGFDQILRRIDDHHAEPDGAARAFDTSIALQLAFRRPDGLAHLDVALQQTPLFRIARNDRRDAPLRLLAILTPGDLMANTPLDFLTNELNIQLDFLYVLPDQALPAVVPDHDIAFFAAGEASAKMGARLAALFAAWPRPALNDPRFLPAMQRDVLPRLLEDIPYIRSPAAVAVSRTTLEAGLDAPDRGNPYPCLIRPLGSHAGSGLALLRNAAQLRDYLQASAEPAFYLTEFEDYRDADGFYRKYRVAFIDRQPFLCHMAISRDWMVHYLNAGMTESAEKRDQEAQAMATFDTGFARRHAAAFEALHHRLGFDYYSIDCGETQDGRLLVFEADSAAIVHMMDPPELFPYKQPQMRRVFSAFGDMLRRRTTG